MQKIVECVPNFSNGRDPEVYGRIVDAISGREAVLPDQPGTRK